MYNIAICDDEQIYLNQITVAIKEIFSANKKSCDIHKFLQPNLLVEKIAVEKSNYDLLFLDILMKEKNGIEIAKEIRKYNDDVSIVFLTNSPDYVFEGYDVKASGYLLKPVDKSKIELLLKKEWQNLNKTKHIIVKEKGVVHKLRYTDLLYFESKGKKVCVVTVNGRIMVYSKLSDFYDILPQDVFVSCHKSYLINLEHVKEIKNGGFYTSQGYFVPISRANYQAAKKSFFKFIGS